ncbi:MAG TPA: hypothetical protein VNC84_06815 [Gammaproteobacteria bacterium]|jgi:hypothetical protein|nr:hypothetical protein [Gammaproteobacteria bacterium]
MAASRGDWLTLEREREITRQAERATERFYARYGNTTQALVILGALQMRLDPSKRIPDTLLSEMASAIPEFPFPDTEALIKLAHESVGKFCPQGGRALVQEMTQNTEKMLKDAAQKGTLITFLSKKIMALPFAAGKSNEEWLYVTPLGLAITQIKAGAGSMESSMNLYLKVRESYEQLGIESGTALFQKHLKEYLQYHEEMMKHEKCELSQIKEVISKIFDYLNKLDEASPGEGANVIHTYTKEKVIEPPSNEGYEDDWRESERRRLHPEHYERRIEKETMREVRKEWVALQKTLQELTQLSLSCGGIADLRRHAIARHFIEKLEEGFVGKGLHRKTLMLFCEAVLTESPEIGYLLFPDIFNNRNAVSANVAQLFTQGDDKLRDDFSEGLRRVIAGEDELNRCLSDLRATKFTKEPSIPYKEGEGLPAAAPVEDDDFVDISAEGERHSERNKRGAIANFIRRFR